MSAIPVSSDGKKPEVCIIELGGTIGDIEGMAFVEAFRYVLAPVSVVSNSVTRWINYFTNIWPFTTMNI